MLDIKKVGIKIAVLRKKIGLSQEKLAEMLAISPQAISKWENGHTLPDTSLLPVLSQIFGCTIDELIMPAYSFDAKIEEEKPNILEQQAEHIAKFVIQKLEAKEMHETVTGLDDNTIINAIQKSNPNLGNYTVQRGRPEKSPRYTDRYITAATPQKEIKLLERVYSGDDKELFGYGLFRRHALFLPHIYHIDVPLRTILMEDLNDNYIQGFHFDENNESGTVIRENYRAFLQTTAKLHSVFWENGSAFEQTGLDWRHESEENLLAHIYGMEKDYLKYRNKEETGEIPKVWEVFENTIEIKKLDCFQDAIQLLKQRYVNLLNTRFHTGKNITIIHGDLHPGNTFLSKSNDRSVKFIDLQAVRIGLCTEDLAMLFALHIEPDRKHAQPLMDYYYHCLCKTVKNYPYEMFINDYQISIMENMFFSIRLINQGIYDFSMRDRAIKAFETFVLDADQ